MILSDTGWQHSQPYRCCSESTRVVVFSTDTPREEVEAMQAQLEKELPGGQERWVRRKAFTLKAYSFCDSSD